MSRLPMMQFPLNRKSPCPEAPRGKLLFKVTLGSDGKQITLDMEQEGCAGQRFIAVKENSLVTIQLAGDQLFFSKAEDAITMKGSDLESFYGDLRYGQYDEKRDRYKSVQFVARFNSGGKYDTTHSFNINVDLLQVTPQGHEWIGLTIDPDIKNPPPKWD